MSEVQPQMILPTEITLLVSAKRLPNTDAGELDTGASDPFFVISAEGTTLGESTVVMNNLNPTWPSVTLDISGMNESVVLDIDVWDKNERREDDYLGSVQLMLGDILNHEGKLTVPFENKSSEEADNPTISVEVVSKDVQDLDLYRTLNNAFLFTFPEIAGDMDEEQHIADFLHDMNIDTELKNDPLFNIGGIVDKVKNYVASMWISIFNGTKCGYPIYLLDVDHYRTDPFHSQFPGKILALRMPLGATKTKDLKTDIGIIQKGDHLLFSVKDVNDIFASKAGFEAERVDLISATRYKGWRFAPISLYFVYRHKDDPEPAYHLVESGTGVSNNTGLIYWGGEFDVEAQDQLGFKPTPWTSKYNYYHHTTSRDGQDPTQVVIHSYQPEKDHPYISVTIDYVRLDDPEDPHFRIAKEQMISPAHATMDALQRMYTLADGFGCLHAHNYAGIELAKAGRCQQWDIEPPVHVAPKPDKC
eukprot:TRINITY_DN6593_c0_g2_i2.p1 TRINITY_DN6593_c0_g2~~TRINITY_DN6593_c0_g2_i2.p1  ORF type:complete len:475 (-),score=119.11 TRINITY_DN6593_c0_g2_i2:799-2223(-)